MFQVLTQVPLQVVPATDLQIRGTTLRMAGASLLELKRGCRLTDLPSARLQHRPGLTPEKPEPYREGAHERNCMKT